MKHIGYRTIIVLAVLAALPVVYHLVPSLQVINTRATAFLILKYVPVLLFGTAGALGYRLNQLRIFLICMLLMIIYLIMMGIGFPKDFIYAQDISLIASITVPLSVCLLLWFDESRVLSKEGGIKIAVCFLPLTVLVLLAKIEAVDVAAYLSWTPVKRLASQWISHFAIFPVVAIAAEIIWFKDKLAGALLTAFSFFLVPFYYALFAQPISPDVLCVTYISGSLTFVYLVLRQFWLNSYIDDLTEVPNRRALEENLKLLPKRWCLAMVDIDHFKKFNDKYGHQAGDEVLRMVAAALDRAPHGQVYRYGGEEFTILYKGCDIYEVGEYVDDLVDTIARRNFTIRRPKPERRKTSAKDRGRKPVPPDKRVKVTISIGVTERREEEKTAHKVIERADKALYRAKKKGRNCAVVVE